MKFAKQRAPLFNNAVELALGGIFECVGPFEESFSDLIYNYDNLYDGDDEGEPEEAPPEVEKEIRRLSAIAQAQLVPSSVPRDTWASGIGPGLLRQNIAKELENYWRENGELPSGTFCVSPSRFVQLPGRGGNDAAD